MLSKFQDFLNNSRICTNPKNDFVFFQTLAHLFLFDEKVKCRWISLELISWGQYSQRKLCCCLFISSMWFSRCSHAVTYQNSVLIKTYCFFDVLNAWSSSLLKLPNYWKISVLSFLKAYLKRVYQGGFSFKDVQYNCNKNQKLWKSKMYCTYHTEDNLELNPGCLSLDPRGIWSGKKSWKCTSAH